MNIILCGLPMSGKTTIGKLLARKMNCHFFDTDKLVEEAYAKTTGRKSSCRQIYLDEGESFFRILEKEQIATLNETKNGVIALGGGSLYCQENTQLLKKIGLMIYLKVPVELIWQRMQVNGIPAFLKNEQSLHDLAESRKLIYETAADKIVEITQLTEQEASQEVLKAITHGS